jgi:hypothetical protein
MVWGEARAAEQCVHAGAPDTGNVLVPTPLGNALNIWRAWPSKSAASDLPDSSAVPGRPAI